MTGLYLPKVKGVTLLGARTCVATEQIRLLDNGERVRVTVDDSGTVTQIEHDHSLDAIVRPATIRVGRRARR